MASLGRRADIVSWQITSFTLLALALVGGMLWYERSRPPSQIVALVAVLAALAVAGRIVLAPIPNVVATTDIVLFAGYVLGPAAGFAVGAISGLVSNFWLGQGAWTPWQMFGWGAAGIFGAVLWKLTSGKAGRLTLAAACGLTGIAFGALMNLQTMVSYGGDMSLARYLALEVRAIPFDLAHMTGNIIFALIAGPAMIAALTRFRERFEWRRVGGQAGLTLMVVCLALFVTEGTAPTEADATSPQAQKAKQWLKKQVNPDGGFGRETGLTSGLGITLDALIAFGRTGTDIDSVKSSKGMTPLGWLRNHASEITKTSSRGERIGNLGKSILALKSVRGSPQSFKGTNLIAELVKELGKDPTAEGRVNAAAYALMALRWAGAGKSEATKTARWLCKAQRSDGGWGISKKGVGDTDTTGAVLLAVGGRRAGKKGVAYLRKQQRANGGFINNELGLSINSQSTALAVQGTMGAGVEPGAVAKNGKTGLDFLRSRQRPAGFIQNSGTSGASDAVWVTAQAIPSLAKAKLAPTVPVDCARLVKSETKPSEEKKTGSSTPPTTTTTTTPPTTTTTTPPSTTPTPKPSGKQAAKPSQAGSNSGSGVGSSSTPSTSPTPSTTTPDPVVPTVIPVVPSQELLAASAPGPAPSPLIATLIGLLVSGGLFGGIILLVRRLRW